MKWMMFLGRGFTWNKKFKSCLEGHLIIKQFQANLLGSEFIQS